MRLLVPFIVRIFRLRKILILCGILLLTSVLFTACRAKKNVKTPMGWLAHKKLGKYQSKHQRRTKKNKHLKKEPVQLWYRDWIKGDKNK